MRDFTAAGCECDVVDYTSPCVPGTRKVGDTLDELPNNARYDWIICSHVIEHVAEPLQILKDLRRHLAPDGVLYVEVPMEIWGKPPLQEEPVTHVNFFNRTSLRHLLRSTGLGPVDVRLGAYQHPNGRKLLAVRSVAGSKLNDTPPLVPGCGETERLLQPGLPERIYRYALTPGNLLGAVRYRIERRFRRKSKISVAGSQGDH